MAATLLAVLAQPVPAAEVGRLAWHTDVAAAWNITQREHRPLLVFVTHDHCLYCDKMKDGTFAEAAVASAIKRSYVPLTLDGAVRTALVKDLAVTSYPTTFVISPEAVVLDRIEGFVAAKELMARLAAAKSSRPAGKLAQSR
jgi:protein disulfide-isomerase